MPDTATLLVFAAAALALIVVPGPAVLYIVAQSIDRGRLAGIVTLSDLLVLLGRGIDRPTKPARRLATHRVAHTKRGRSHAAW